MTAENSIGDLFFIDAQVHPDMYRLILSKVRKGRYPVVMTEKSVRTWKGATSVVRGVRVPAEEWRR